MSLREWISPPAWRVAMPRTRAAWLTLPLFALATAGAFIGKELDRPISSAVIYLLGVLMIGAGWGLRLGVVFAILASLIYNLLLTEPTLVFTFASADEYVPLIAFNAAALLSGALAGRLNDRAQAAEYASRRLSILFELSRSLQRATDVRAVGEALAETCASHELGRAELFIFEQGRLSPVGPSSAFLAEALRADVSSAPEADPRTSVIKLNGSQGVIGILAHGNASADRGGKAARLMDWGAASVLLAVAVERCLLLRAAAEKDALRESEAFKSALLASVSHDLRTPLAAITASATSLKSYGDRLASGDREAMLTVIQEQGARLDRYTRNLLSVARLQSDIDESSLAVMDLRELLGSAISAVRAIAPGHVITKAFPDHEVLVRGNPVMVEQVFFNVLENAVQYSESGSCVDVRIDLSDAGVTVSVVDEGRGIPAPDLERVFERFYRSPSSAGIEGQGLGLSIAMGVAERFGGSIRAVSPVMREGGTRIEISFPLHQEKVA